MIQKNFIKIIKRHNTIVIKNKQKIKNVTPSSKNGDMANISEHKNSAKKSIARHTQTSPENTPIYER